ncbi:SRPBCC domain-containing protein [Streptomonospora nanhaiensis]|uniref:SRPBCC domain-containing protein n=1 Tax=Streptomonospora nanhaiensis TaxID=1323731 RepID=A0ABY6YH20_9ACTN|nr:SRPBCC domain-containing protein [Streptomonospora nanhaiensis]WAE71560.1 SRPBCC domain-containing protein [Streptomonospora nanhaiensis]
MGGEEPRTDRGTRTVRASAAAVYRAMTDPGSLEAWLPPEGMTGRMERFEPWAGGGFRMVLTYLDPAAGHGKTSDASDVTDVGFAELVPGERIVQRVAFESEDPAFAGTMTMTWRLAETEDGTEVTVEATDVPRGISQADHEDGLASSLANLAAHVEA